ncbi:MAG: AI-2E family transporter [Chloroflexi bacterium]|nr:AI-2E family transporter [Chloroflexota bacterium]
MSPSWGRTTKQWIVAIWLIVGALAIYSLWNLVLPLSLAILLAYMMNPLVDGIVARSRLPRLLVTALVYLVLVVLISLAPILIVPEGFIQPISRAQLDLNQILLSLRDSIASYGTLRVAGYVVDPTQVYQLVLDNLQASLSQVAPRSVNVFFGVATGFATTVLWLIFILVVSFYLVKDSPTVLDYIDSQLPPPYRDEVWNLIYTIGDVWNAFLRGQLLLGTVVGVTVGVSMFVLGVSNAAVL